MAARHNKNTEFSGNSKDFAGHIETQEVQRDPVFAFTPNPIEIEHEFRNTTAYVGPQTKQSIEVNSPSACKSILNALVDLHDGTVFAHVEVGLHLRCPLEDFSAIPYHQNIGVLGASYITEDHVGDRFYKLAPEQGWVRLGVNFGVVTARPIVFIEPMKGESDYVRHDRKSIMLHGAMDSLLKGFCYHIKPYFFKGDGELADGAMSLVERQAAFISKYAEVMGMTPAERRVSYQQTVLAQQERRAYGKVISERIEAEENGDDSPVIATIPLIDGSRATLEDLQGKVVKKWAGRVDIAGTKTITAENFFDFAAVCAKRNYKVEVIGVATEPTA